MMRMSLTRCGAVAVVTAVASQPVGQDAEPAGEVATAVVHAVSVVVMASYPPLFHYPR